MESIDRRRFMQVAGAGAAGLALTDALASEAFGKSTKRPNIVLLMADDLGVETLGCYGGESYKTPHLDELARTGIRFDYGYSTPLCTPSRVQIMTGRYPFRTGFTKLIDSKGEHYFNPQKETTFGNLLREAGYATALAGKWQLCDFAQHPNNVAESGFDEYCCWTWTYQGKKMERYSNPSIWQNGELLKNTEGQYGPDIHGAFLMDFIRRNRENPFLVYYPMCLPHDPHHFPPGIDQSKGEFHAMVEHLDTQVGEMVALLDELKLRENTLILFTGDNGTARGIESIRNGRTIKGGKKSVSETGSHVPFIANWQGTAPKGKVLDDLVDFSDILPTLAELGGAKVPDDRVIDGRSFAPQLHGKKGKPREWVYVQLENERFIRDQRYMLYNDGRLYDTKTDPDQQHPTQIAEDPVAAVKTRKRLQSALDQLLASG